jgi:hypothetical protein
MYTDVRDLKIRSGPRKSIPPSVLDLKSLCYMGYISTWLDLHSCLLMQEATTFNIIYDGISFQHLATVSVSVFTLCYVPGLLFHGPFCIIAVNRIKLIMCLEFSVPEPYRSPDWPLVLAKTGPKAEY